LAFNKGSIIEETIDLCAAISAKAHGDAGKAIELLRAFSNICRRTWLFTGTS